MEWWNFKFVSENTLEFLALHECMIDHTTFSDGTLIFEVSSLDVLPEHPLNTYPVARNTSEAALVFEDTEVIESVLFDTSNAAGPIIGDDDIVRVSIPVCDLAENFEILQATDHNPRGDRFVTEFLGDAGRTTNRPRGELAVIRISFSKVYVCWNELDADSWFVNWPPK